MIWPKEVTLVSRTSPSGSLCPGNVSWENDLNAWAHEWDGLIFHPIHHVGESRSEDQDGVKERTTIAGFSCLLSKFDWRPNLCGAATSTGASSFVLWWPVIWPEEERREWWSRTSSISSHALFSTIKVKKRNSGKCVYHDCWWFSSLLLWSCGSQSKKDKVAQANTPVITIYNPAPCVKKNEETNHCAHLNKME